MSDKKENNNTKCPDCNCPKCPEQQKCPEQITMEDIIKAVMPGKSPFYTFGEFHMNGKNVDTDLKVSGTDRWEGSYMFHLQPQPYNPSAQGIMPFTGAIRDKYMPKLDTAGDILNAELEIDTRIDEKLIDQLRFPGKVNNAYSDRGQNSTNRETIDE
tara:strand:+ start:8251 stop:8721 length:471 start_codon:yes stop_codon:yes gene_type:complete